MLFITGSMFWPLFRPRSLYYECDTGAGAGDTNPITSELLTQAPVSRVGEGSISFHYCSDYWLMAASNWDTQYN